MGVALILVTLLGLVAAPMGPTAKDSKNLASRLRWQRDGLSLAVGGWVISDLVSMPRTETGFGPSWNIKPQLRSARLAAHVGLSPRLGARLSVELADLISEVQEAWAGYHVGPWLDLRVGRVRLPFGLSQQERLATRSLMEAPMVAGNPKDFRDVGLSASGHLLASRLRYGAAVTAGSRAIGVDVNERPDATLRLTIHPLVGLGPWLAGLHLGASGSYGAGPNRNGFRVRTTGDHTVMTPPMVRGRQERWGAELGWRLPRGRLVAEYQWQRQQRNELTDNQQVGGNFTQVGDLAPYRIRGAYVEGAWLLVGDMGRIMPRTGLELDARFESIEFGDGFDLRTVAAGQEDHAPLTESWVEAISVGVNIYPLDGLRVGLVWQGIRFGRSDLAPNYKPTQAAASMSGWVHHLMARVHLAAL